MRSPLGFDPHATLTAKVALGARVYSDERSVVFYGQLLEKLNPMAFRGRSPGRAPRLNM